MLTMDQALRAIAALEAAWAQDTEAIDALAGTGQDEEPLAAVVAEFVGEVLRGVSLAATGITDLPEEQQRAAAAEFSKGILAGMLAATTRTFRSWAVSAGSDVGPTRDLAVAGLNAILGFAAEGVDDPDAVKELFNGMRAEAMARL
ncbi:hypothetical protein ACIRD3_12735 [Kitasatospora sp. NPDC093550]|uniref:hypothetical protein n=1 Tax=Kitasatospora sp. NPDC093550 TaxID=3364089 RepID=UPI003808951D